MAHNFPSPSDAEIESLITKVYESSSNPDQSRLSLIESRLLHNARKNKPQKKLNKIPWWIVLVLAGGFASTAWWAGELYFGEENKVIEGEQQFSDDKFMMISLLRVILLIIMLEHIQKMTSSKKNLTKKEFQL